MTRTASAVAVAVMMTLQIRIIRTRLWRSAHAPPRGAPIRAGVHPATTVRPSQRGLCVVNCKYTPRATACIQPPREEIRAADHASRKFRWAKGAHEARFIVLTLPAEP